MAAAILAQIRDAQSPPSLIQITMQNLHDGFQQLDVKYAMTGRAARCDIGVGNRVSKITIALVDNDTSPDIVAKKLAEMTFDSGQPFTFSESGELTYSDLRFFSTTPDHRIVLFSISSLPLASQIRYHESCLVKSRQGWNMVSPFFLLLDYLVKAMERIRKYIKSGETTVKVSESPDGSHDISVISSKKASKLARHLSKLIEKQTPGNPADKQFLEEHHIEAVKYISSFVPEIRSFLPFESIFLHTSAENTEITSESNSTATHSHIQRSATATPTPTSPPMTCSSRMTTPGDELEGIKHLLVQTDTASDSDASVEPPSVKYLPKSPAPCPLKSVQWAAASAICTILLIGLSPALMGNIANMMYSVPTIPSNIEIAVYTPPKPNFGADKIKRWIVTQDSKNFKMVHTYLFCSPPKNSDLGFEFVVPGPNTQQSKYGYRIDIVLPSTAPLPQFDSTSLNHTEWVQLLPVVPFGLALLHALKRWFVAVQEEEPTPVQEEHAKTVFVLLQQDKYLQNICEMKPWDDATMLDKDLRKQSRSRVKLYIKESTHGPASKAAWNRLGLV